MVLYAVLHDGFESMAARWISLEAFARRLADDEGGQELIEYAILTALIAVGSVLLFAQLATTMNTAYAGTTGFNQATQNAWEPCPPLPASCP